MVFQKGHKINPIKRSFVPCSNCDKMVEKSNYQIKKQKIFFCNKFCMGGYMKKYNLGVNSPHYGIKHREESKRKMSLAHKGKKLSEEHKRKIGLASKGHKVSEEARKKISLSKIGDKNPMKREDVRIKSSISHIGFKHSEETKRKIGIAHKGNQYSKGIPKTENWLRIMKKKMSGKKNPMYGIKIIGEKHWNWQGGKSFESYGLGFNKKLREQIRKRDGYECQQCGINQGELGYLLNIHHIDFNKKNNNPWNLISLCKTCHSQTNFNRQNWINYFKNKLVEKI